MPRPKVLLANEAGIGRGHIVKLAAIAKALGGGLPLVAGLARLKHADELAAIGAVILAAPVMGYTAQAVANPHLEGNASWGDYLFAMGLAREDVVRRGLAWWTKAIVDHDISILIADYAPLAMLAARGLKQQGWEIEIICAGTGYSVPPADLAAFPQLLPDYGHVVHQEADVLAMLNRVAAEFDIAPLPTLPALYEVDLAIPATFAFLDPYRTMRPASALVTPQVDVAATMPDTLSHPRDEVFVYFSTTELQEDAVVQALASCTLPRRAFLPGANADTAALLANAGVILEQQPVAVAAIAARSRLVLHASQHGIICLAALAGLPQIGLPQHLEHTFHGRRAGQQGILDQLERRNRSAAAVADMITEVYHDRTIQSRARDFADDLRNQQTRSDTVPLHDLLAPLLERATQALR